MSVIKKFIEYFNVSIDYLLGSDLHVIKDEMVGDNKQMCFDNAS